VKRIVAIALLAAAVVAVVVVVSSREGEEPYRVRAIFDNAGFVIPGEDVKVAGVKVGKIDALDVTEDFRAVVVLDIEDPAYQDFRSDAECMIRPQSLIGERYVECEPTQKRSPGAEAPPELERVQDGPGKGQRLLPVENTSKPVDLDLLNNITREPERARLSIILNELGTGVAGRGKELREVIRRANPALKEIDRVLAILASENDTLQRLAVDGDTVLAPLARERRHVSSAIENSSEVAQATAERRADLEADIERLPRFLSELRPTMERLGALSDEMTPVLTDLGDVAPDINRLLLELGPFSEAAIPAFETLGDAARTGTPAVTRARPVIADLRRFARAVRPVGRTGAALLESFQKTRGIERLMDYVFYQVAAINGFDSFGHYLRAGLIVNQCSSYKADPTPGCSANFAPPATATAATAETGPRAPGDPVLKATTEALARALRGDAPRVTPTPSPRPRPTVTPDPGPKAAPTPAATPVATPTPAPGSAPAPSRDDTLMDYLFGKDPE
jgi:phospholipid/cholesterol/gamma-HCH transport system substrate-binding protein